MFTHDPDAETEKTVSTGKLLGLFLLLVVLCGVFFVLGYSFGRSTAAASLKPAPASASPSAPKPSSVDSPDATTTTAAATPPTTPYITSTPPPGAIPAPPPQSPPQPVQPQVQPAPQSAPQPAPTPPSAYTPPAGRNARRSAPSRSAPAYSASAAAPAPYTPPPARKPAAPESTRAASPQGSYVVQVAAVSKKQDADALSAALRRKQYQVFVAQTETNGLYRVQIGPFGDRKDAEVVRLLLVSDGYNPIVK
jgi:cell division protein FtsN